MPHTAGDHWSSEMTSSVDPVSGVTVRQLTNYRGHSHHFYFTNPGWYDDGRRLLFSSDRDNRTNLFSLDLNDGSITQLTDLAPLPKPLEVEFLRACLNPTRAEAYFWYGLDMIALDLHTLKHRVLWRRPEGFLPSMNNCTADGKYVLEGIWQDLSDRIATDLLRGYVGFEEICEARPLSRIMRVATDGSSVDCVHEEKYWVGHVNTSPTQPHLITYCHEGPWSKVDHRIWGMDIDRGETWRIRPRKMPEERIGHEYWHADGLRVGYHGHNHDGAKFFGHVRYDDTDRVEVSFNHHTGHIHSNDANLIVGDGGSVVRLWRWNGSSYDGPRVLCEHRSSMHIQQTHVHPRFTPDGTQVLFTTDRTGYGNVYLADVPAFESLPMVEGK